MSKIKNGGLDQYDAGPFEQQQFGIAGVIRVKTKQKLSQHKCYTCLLLGILLDVRLEDR